VVPVAPNPQPLPRLALWQRVALVSAALLVLLVTALAVPAPRSTASGSFDPLRIGPAQPRSTLLRRGESSRWYLRTPLPVARARSIAVTVDDNIYIIGGEVDQVVSGDVLLYQPISNTWQTVSTPKPTPVANAAAAAVDRRIYMVGGTTADGQVTDRLEMFDTTTKRWQALAPLPIRVAGHALAAFGKQLFVFGGMTALGSTSAAYRYDIAQDIWEPVQPLPTRRSLAAAAALEGRIYVVGGYDNGHELATCEAFDPASDHWNDCAPMTIPRSGLGLARIGANLFAIGGGVSGFIGFNERYDAASNRWTAIETPLASDWQSTAVAARDTEFYVFGGYSGGERLAFTYVYEVFTNRVFVPAFQSPGEKR
jgi:N-acetylneuraminic acid mutarotase